MIVWISECPFARGGFATVTREMLGRLKDRYRVASVCFGAPTVMSYDGYNVYPYARPVQALIERIERDHDDRIRAVVVHGSPWTPPYSTVLEDLQPFRGEFPVIGYFVHEALRLPPDVAEYFRPGRYVDAVAVPVDEVARLAGVSDYFVVPHGADPNLFQPSNRKLSRFTVSMVAANYIRKRWDLFFRALAGAVKRGMDIAGLAIVPESGTWYIERLIWAVKEEVGNFTVGLPRPYDADIGIPTTELARVLASTHAYLHMTMGEAWGLPIGEALLAGLPTAAVDHPAIRAWTRGHVKLIKPCREHFLSYDGLVYPVPCVEDAVDWIQHLIEDYDEEVAHLLENRGELVQMLDWNRAARRMGELIDKLVGW